MLSFDIIHLTPLTTIIGFKPFLKQLKSYFQMKVGFFVNVAVGKIIFKFLSMLYTVLIRELSSYTLIFVVVKYILS